MKIRHVDDNSIIVELTRHEFSGITGVKVKYESTSRYSDGVEPKQIVGKDYELDKAIEAYYSLKVAHELKERITLDLQSLIVRLSEATWPLPEYKKIEVKP